MELYRGKRLSVEKKMFRLPDGREREKIVVHPGDAVAILPFTDDGGCYLIRQYRFAIDSFIYEVPAGTMEEDEDPEETARRELIEETGFSAGKIITAGASTPRPVSQTSGSISSKHIISLRRPSSKKTKTR